MKTTSVQLFVSILCIVCLAATGSCFAADKDQRPDIDIEFMVSIDKVAAKSPETMLLYRCAPDRSAKAQESQLKEIFGNAFFLETVEMSGGIFAANMERLWSKPPDPSTKGTELQEKVALEQSKNFLNRIKGIPEEKTLVYFSGDRMEFIQKDGEQRSVPAGWNVTYRRLLQDFEVMGPGGKIKIFMGTDGDVVGYMRVWRQLTLEKQVPIISAHEAAEEFKKDPVGRALIADVEKIKVTDMRLAYLELGMSMPQHYLQPVYFIKAIAFSKGKKEDLLEIPYTRYIAALMTPPQALWPEGREYKSQERIEKKYRPGDDE